MMYECPLKYRYGAECQLTCRSGYPLVGADKIQCLKEDENADPPKLNWTWPPNQLKPYCKGILLAIYSINFIKYHINIIMFNPNNKFWNYSSLFRGGYFLMKCKY